MRADGGWAVTRDFGLQPPSLGEAPAVDCDARVRSIPVVGAHPRSCGLPIDHFVDEDSLLSLVMTRRLGVEVEVAIIDARQPALVDNGPSAPLETDVDRAATLGPDEVSELRRGSPRNVPGRLSAREAGTRSFVLQRHLDERVERKASGGSRPIEDGLQIGREPEGDRHNRLHAPLCNRRGCETQPRGNDNVIKSGIGTTLTTGITTFINLYLFLSRLS